MCGVTKVVLKTVGSIQTLPIPVNNVCYRIVKNVDTQTLRFFFFWCGVTKVVLGIVDNMEMLSTPVNNVYYRIVKQIRMKAPQENL